MKHIVEINKMAFVPSSLEISKGDTVIWQNKEGMTHTATRKEMPSFDTGPIMSNQSSEAIPFNEPSGLEGFEYHCTPHPFMRGFIIVI